MRIVSPPEFGEFDLVFAFGPLRTKLPVRRKDDVVLRRPVN